VDSEYGKEWDGGEERTSMSGRAWRTTTMRTLSQITCGACRIQQFVAPSPSAMIQA
jgi:hypothetical protein